jgi:acetylornithine/N-succinyldiaminopimelate aminotransferase
MATIEDDALLSVRRLGKLIEDSFCTTLQAREMLREVRRAGLMIGIELQQDCAELVGRALEAGLLINVTAGSTIRLLPPLVMSDAQAEQLGSTLATVVDRWVDEHQLQAGAA